MPSLELIGRPVVIGTLSCQLKEQPAWPRLLVLSTSGAFCEKSLRQDSLYPCIHKEKSVSQRSIYHTRTISQWLPHTAPGTHKEKWWHTSSRRTISFSHFRLHWKVEWGWGKHWPLLEQWSQSEKPEWSTLIPATGRLQSAFFSSSCWLDALQAETRGWRMAMPEGIHTIQEEHP